jgi:ribonuclease R
MRSEDLAERILGFLGRTDYRPQKLRTLARSLGIAEDEYGEFRDVVKGLMAAGRLVLGSSKAITLPGPTGRVVGTFRGNARGFGFVVPDTPNSHGDLYVPAGQTGGAVTGDTVEARVVKRGKRGGKMLYEGRVVAIIKRGQNHFVGELHNEFGRWFVRPDGNTLHAPVFVDDPTAKSARAGDQVVVEVVRYPDAGREARGVIVRVLGERGLPEVDTLSIIVQYQFPEAFPEAVLEGARSAAASFDPQRDAEGREDLRDMTIITIDPDDARDFDDAISLTEVDGGVELGVHIADVSHFVRPGTALDDEAKARSTSIYFPRHVIPMLPETLSNGVCSLQEREDRLTKSVFITYDREGHVKKTRFANSIIRSTRRLTYRQATAALEGKGPRLSAKVAALLKAMEQLARAIQKRRLAQGLLVLDLPEVELVYDEDNRVIGVTPADTSFSHTIIEMFMVEANEAVARLFAGSNIPCLRRIHPEPDEGAAEQLARFLAALGVKVPKNLDRFGLQTILARAKGSPASFAINLAVLRSLEQAEYSPKLIGHHALASEHYLHFTSPIRRYPDLTVHRLLDEWVKGGLRRPADRGHIPSVAELTRLGEHCSRNERRAEDAERELRMVKILQLLEQHVGDEMEGVVTGVTNFGLFVQLREYLVDGLLRFNELADDWWEVDTQRGCVVAERSGQRIGIGQVLKVTIVQVDVAARQLDLALAGTLDGSAGKGKTKGARHAPKSVAGRSKVKVRKGGGGRRSRPRSS